MFRSQSLHSIPSVFASTSTSPNPAKTRTAFPFLRHRVVERILLHYA